MNKNILRIFVYVSLAFLIIYLIRNDEIEKIRISNFNYFYISITLLFLTFLINPFRWWLINRFTGHYISYSLALRSTGFSIFGKYIPGKVWMVLGKASIVSRNSKHSITDLLNNSFYSQILGIISGLLFGLPFLFRFNSTWFVAIYFVLIFLLLFIAYNGIPFSWIPARFKKIKERFTALHSLSFKQVNILLITFISEWILLGIGFLYLYRSITDVNPGFELSTISLFPFSSVLGILAIFTPGGLGIREGVLAYLMELIRLEDDKSITIAAASRIWFLFGEVFIFLIGVLIALPTMLKKWKRETI